MSARTNLHYCTPERLNRYRDSVANSAQLTEKNKEAILKFYALCTAQGLSNSRLAKTLWIMRILGAMFGEKDFETASKEDLIGLVNDIHGRYQNANTREDYKVMLKKFYRCMFGNDDRPPKCIAWLKPQGARSGTRDESQMITEPEALRLLRAQESLNAAWSRTRNKALIAFLYDAGVRVGELLDMRLRDIQVGKELWRVTVRGKTGQRTFPVYTSVPYLKDYLNIHPRPGQPDAPLWCSYNFPEQSISYPKVAIILRETFRRAGVAKPCNPHNFRHSAVSRDSTFMSDQQLKKKYGWTPSSRRLDVYSHLRLELLEAPYQKRYGLEQVEKEDWMVLKRCVGCNSEVKPHEQFCPSCRSPMSAEGAIERENRTDALAQLAVEFLSLLGDENPQIKLQFRQLVERKQLQHLFIPKGSSPVLRPENLI